MTKHAFWVIPAKLSLKVPVGDKQTASEYVKCQQKLFSTLLDTPVPHPVRPSAKCTSRQLEYSKSLPSERETSKIELKLIKKSV